MSNLKTFLFSEDNYIVKNLMKKLSAGVSQLSVLSDTFETESEDSDEHCLST